MEVVNFNAVSRLTGVCKPAILKLLTDLGQSCLRFHNERVRGLKPARVETDEVWSFVYCKEKGLRPEFQGTYGLGDCWLWTAIDPDTKLIISYHIGQRTPTDAVDFMIDLSTRIVNETTLPTDGLNYYPDAVREAFGDCVHYGQVVKMFNQEPANEARYSPAKCTGCKKKAVIGGPRGKDISSSIIERSNLTLRQQNRRFTRLTLGHSKNVANHEYSIALYWAFYNWCRPHVSLKGKTPAQVSGLTDHRWTLV